jgi:hypothetical protein
MVDWCDAGVVRLHDPFFHQSVEEVLAGPTMSPARLQTPVEALTELAAQHPGLTPTGFVFHASRCGSTLVAQVLAASPANRVLSEPGPVDDVLRTGWRPPLVPEAFQVDWLRAVVSALGRARGGERRLFVKFDPWHTLALSLVRRAFPEVPWLFCFRDPVEILVSQQRSTGSQFTLGPLPSQLFGLDLATAALADPEVYRATVLARLFGAAADSLDDVGLLVDHADLPGALDEVGAHFGLAPDESERAAMAAVAPFDAKHPARPFVPDGADKQAAADDGLRAAAATVVPAYQRLRDLQARRRARRQEASVHRTLQAATT